MHLRCGDTMRNKILCAIAALASFSCSMFGGRLFTAIEHGDSKAAIELIRTHPSITSSRQDHKNNPLTPLMYAAVYNRSDVAACLIESGVDVNETTGEYTFRSGWTALHYAAAYNAPETAIVLMKAGAKPTGMAPGQGWTPLHVAASYGHARPLKAMLDAGAPPDARDGRGTTALMAASRSMNISDETALVLLKYGADPNVRGGRIDPIRTNWTALMWAAFYNKTDLVRALIARGASPDIKSGEGMTALMVAADVGIHSAQRIPVVRALLESGASTSVRDNEGKTALHHNIKNLYLESYDIAVMKLLVQYKADVNARTNDGETPLVFAVKQASDASKIRHKIEVIRTLLAVGADVNIATKNGRTALYELLDRPDLGGKLGKGAYDPAAMLDMVLAAGADVNARCGSEQRTALFPAVYWNYADAVRALVRHKAEVNVQDAGGYTPLILAVRGNALTSIGILLSAGADIAMENKHGRSAIGEAAAADRDRVIALFVERGISLAVREKSTGWTPLMIACASGSNAAAKAIVNARVNLNETDRRGRTALMIVADARAREIDLLKMFDTARGAAGPADYAAIAELLIGAGADVNARDLSGESALSYARKTRQASVEQVLLKHGAK